MDLKELTERRKEVSCHLDSTIDNMQTIANESFRVSEVAHNSEKILNDLDQEFESQTGLRGKDIKFLFAATALQVARIVIINNLTNIEAAGTGNRNETVLHNFQEKILGKFDVGEVVGERPYYASMEHIISRLGVPYDATAILSSKSINTLKEKGETWADNLEDIIPNEKIHLFRGANHRFSTLGHDPILGLVFGTANIMTNTITCVKAPAISGSIHIGLPVLTTNHVVYTSSYKDPRIADYGSTLIMLKETANRTREQPSAFVASLIKQIIHIGTDLYTPCGIQIPGANLVLSNSSAEKLTKYISTGDLIKIGASSEIAELINCLISALHTLMYDPATSISRELYSVRTRKIIMYSNVIATGSNLIWTGINVSAGNVGAIKQLDFGGLIVTVHRLVSDREYINRIKEEFVLGGFEKIIHGDELELKKLPWETLI